MAANRESRLIIGRISSVFGIKGWVKVVSHTQPRENIFNYPIWLVKKDSQWHEISVEEGRPHGKTLIAKLKDVHDREQAQAWTGATIAVNRDMLPETEDGEYYWADLIGLIVVTKEGETLGKVKRLMETGSNDVLVVVNQEDKQEHLVPWIEEQVILNVDIEQGRIEVDWDINY